VPLFSPVVFRFFVIKEGDGLLFSSFFRDPYGLRRPFAAVIPQVFSFFFPLSLARVDGLWRQSFQPAESYPNLVWGPVSQLFFFPRGSFSSSDHGVPFAPSLGPVCSPLMLPPFCISFMSAEVRGRVGPSGTLFTWPTESF